MDQSSQPLTDRRRYFGFSTLGYTVPAVSALAVPTLLKDESLGAELQPGMMTGMMPMMMMMMMHRPGMMRTMKMKMMKPSMTGPVRPRPA
jgi:hypothetical protein